MPATFLLLLLGLYLYEPQVQITIYDRGWIHKEIDPIAPLAGCFDEASVSPRYNVSEFVHGAKKNEVQAGIPLRMGLDCYDFAGTIKQEPRTGRKDHSISPEDRTLYHTYWRVDLAAFGPRQEWMLKSFFATQDLSSSRLILWSNGNLNSNILQTYLTRYPDSFALQVVDIPSLAKGTALEGSSLLNLEDARAWVDGDLVRLLLLWNYGGIWVDMDLLLTRDLDPLLEHEFVTQWDCHGMIFCSGLASYF
jgi:Glycosyltransferase sugar-binding region containing DXD motif